VTVLEWPSRQRVMRTPDIWHLKTERLSLLPVQASKAGEFFPLLSDPSISKDMGWEAHTEIEQSQQFLTEAESSLERLRAVHWTVRHQRTLIGLFSLIDVRGRHRAIDYDRAELAYLISPNFQRLGLMTEAAVAVINFAFTQMCMNKLIVSHHAGNTASEKLIRKLKFQHLYLEKEAFSKNGTKIDVHHYELLYSAWKKRDQVSS